MDTDHVRLTWVEEVLVPENDVGAVGAGVGVEELPHETRSAITRFATGVPLPVTRSYPAAAVYLGEPVLPPVVTSWKSPAFNA